MDEQNKSNIFHNARHPERSEGSPACGADLAHNSVQHCAKSGRSFTAFRMTWGVTVFRSFLVILGSALYMLVGAVQANQFVFSPKTLHWKAINDKGVVVRTGRGSGGRSYCPDIHRSCRTPTGTFHVISKGGPGCRSSLYPVGRGGSPMPYCMFFSKYYAVHGSYEVPDYNASHGCIRVIPSDAHWLSKNFIHVGTTVVVKSY